VGFFDRYLAELSSAPVRPKPPRPAWVRPEDVLPAIVAADLVLARTGEFAAAIPVLRAYPSGFAFHLAVRLRVADDEGRMSSALHGPYGHPRGRPDNDMFRLAVVYADGRTAANVGPTRHPLEPGDELMLSPEGGGGGGHSWDLNFWVHPLPPPGPLVFICEWPAGGVPESRAEIDAQLLLDASARAVQLWPEPEDDAS
jgi:hypothetical protein